MRWNYAICLIGARRLLSVVLTYYIELEGDSILTLNELPAAVLETVHRGRGLNFPLFHDFRLARCANRSGSSTSSKTSNSLGDKRDFLCSTRVPCPSTKVQLSFGPQATCRYVKETFGDSSFTVRGSKTTTVARLVSTLTPWLVICFCFSDMQLKFLRN